MFNSGNSECRINQLTIEVNRLFLAGAFLIGIEWANSNPLIHEIKINCFAEQPIKIRRRNNASLLVTSLLLVLLLYFQYVNLGSAFLSCLRLTIISD